MSFLPIKNLFFVLVLLVGWSLQSHAQMAASRWGVPVVSPAQDSELEKMLDEAIVALADTKLFQMVARDSLQCQSSLIASQFGLSRELSWEISQRCKKDFISATDKDTKLQVGGDRSCLPTLLKPKSFYFLSSPKLIFESWTDLNNATYINFLKDEKTAHQNFSEYKTTVREKKTELILRLYHELYIMQDRGMETGSRSPNLSNKLFTTALASMRALRAEVIDAEALKKIGIPEKWIGGFEAMRSPMSEKSCLDILENKILSIIVDNANQIEDSTSIENKMMIVFSSHPTPKTNRSREENLKIARDSIEEFRKFSQSLSASQVEPCLEWTKPEIQLGCYVRQFGPRPPISGSGE